jgi:hypothetical protein
MGRLKVFVAYHKKTPLYKSDVFEPIQVGARLSGLSLKMMRDDVKDNISALNPYFCELTGYYSILKNYLSESDEDYIGFSHYRRLIDLTQISDIDSPSIYGLNYSNSLKVFKSFEKVDLASCCDGYDIILPCSAYMYKSTVNPILKEDDSPIDMYHQFKIEHNNNLMDILREVITSDFPEYIESLEYCFSKTSAHFYNIYVMKKAILKEYLEWVFDVLFKIGDKIGGWQNSSYYRMAGFVSERLINIWLRKNLDRQFKIGFVPIYMIDFEAEYISNANSFDYIKRYDLEVEELIKLLDVCSNKSEVLLGIIKLYIKLNDRENIDKYIDIYLKQAKDLLSLARIIEKVGGLSDILFELYKKMIATNPQNKEMIKRMIVKIKDAHNIEYSKYLWDCMSKLGLENSEKSEYDNILKTYSLIKNKS